MARLYIGRKKKRNQTRARIWIYIFQRIAVHRLYAWQKFMKWFILCQRHIAPTVNVVMSGLGECCVYGQQKKGIEVCICRGLKNSSCPITCSPTLPRSVWMYTAYIIYIRIYACGFIGYLSTPLGTNISIRWVVALFAFVAYHLAFNVDYILGNIKKSI